MQWDGCFEGPGGLFEDTSGEEGFKPKPHTELPGLGFGCGTAVRGNGGCLWGLEDEEVVVV